MGIHPPPLSASEPLNGPLNDQTNERPTERPIELNLLVKNVCYVNLRAVKTDWSIVTGNSKVRGVGVRKILHLYI